MGNAKGVTRWTLDQIALDTGVVERIAMTFLGHGFTQDPTSLRRAAVFEKKGPGGAMVDLVTREITARIEPSPGCAFYGHGLFSPDGSRLYVVEAELASKRGRLTVKDGRTLATRGELATHGSSPHDCVFAPDGRTLVVTNGGGEFGGMDAPSVVFVDPDSGKLEERVTLTNPRFNAGHLALSTDGALVVVSAPRAGLAEETNQGGVSIRPAGGKMSSVKQPGDVTRAMLGESLSVAIHEPTGVALVTNPKGSLVTFWRVADRSLVKTMPMPSPRGVVLARDESAFVLGCGLEAGVLLVSTETLEPIAREPFGDGIVSGSHVYLREDPPEA
jgi:hypothetical protein